MLAGLKRRAGSPGRGAARAAFLSGLTWLAVGTVLGCSEPRPPAFEVGLWPGEGRPRFEAVGEPLELRAAAEPDAAVVHTIPAPPTGMSIDYDEVLYRTVSPGRIAVIGPDTIRGRTLGDVRHLSRDAYYSSEFPRETHPVQPGDTIEYLQQRAEGTCFVRIDGAVVEASLCPTHRPESFEPVDAPRVEQWIRVLPAGAPAGWLRVDESTVREAGRAF